MRRLLVLAAACLAVAGCGGDNTGNKPVDREAIIGQLLENVSGTVGAKGTPCVESYLRDRTDDELDKLLNDLGNIDDGDRAFTAAVVACVDG